MFGSVWFNATSKCMDLSYKLGYLIMAELFRPIPPVHPVCPDIIHIFWISTFCGHYPYFGDRSVFRGYYLHIVDIVDISASC